MTNKLNLEIQQYAARYLLKKDLDPETIKELKGSMMRNRLGPEGLRALNNEDRNSRRNREHGRYVEGIGWTPR